MNTTSITTSRTRLRPIVPTDLASIHQLHACPEVDQYNALGVPKDINETKTIITPWIKDMEAPKIKNYTFAIETKAEKAFVGLFGLKVGTEKYKRAEVWYKIHPDHWNKGFATETLKAIITYSFETLHLHRIQAGCAVANIGSIKVLEKVGMIREGRGRQVLPLASGWSDNFEYAMLESDERL